MQSTPAPPSHQPQADDTAARLLACARDLFLAEGVAGFSMRKVASAAGVSATAIYRHYDDKEALLFAVAEEGFRRLGQQIGIGLAAPDPLARLSAACDGYQRFALDHTEYYRVIFMSETLTTERLTEAAKTRFQPIFQLLVDRVRECQDAGLLRAGEPAGLALSVLAHIHGLVSLWIGGHLAPLSERAAFVAFFRGSIQDLLSGLRP